VKILSVSTALGEEDFGLQELTNQLLILSMTTLKIQPRWKNTW